MADRSDIQALLDQIAVEDFAYYQFHLSGMDAEAPIVLPSPPAAPVAIAAPAVERRRPMAEAPATSDAPAPPEAPAMPRLKAARVAPENKTAPAAAPRRRTPLVIRPAEEPPSGQDSLKTLFDRL